MAKHYNTAPLPVVGPFWWGYQHRYYLYSDPRRDIDDAYSWYTACEYKLGVMGPVTTGVSYYDGPTLPREVMQKRWARAKELAEAGFSEGGSY